MLNLVVILTKLVKLVACSHGPLVMDVFPPDGTRRRLPHGVCDDASPFRGRLPPHRALRWPRQSPPCHSLGRRRQRGAHHKQHAEAPILLPHQYVRPPDHAASDLTACISGRVDRRHHGVLAPSRPDLVEVGALAQSVCSATPSSQPCPHRARLDSAGGQLVHAVGADK